MVSEISVDELKQKMDRNEDFLLLDVREQHELQYGTIPGFVHIPMGEVPQRIAELPKNKEILCLCRTGHRSGEVAALLRERGFAAKNITGGILAWKKYDHRIMLY